MEKINEIPPIDIDKIRSDTPGCANKIHFNNAGASLPPTPVTEAIVQYIALEAENGGYETADKKANEIRGFYESAAKLLGTQANNIAFTTSATSSFMVALSCIPFSAGDTVLIANEDYVSNQITFLSLQKRFNIKLLRAKSNPAGGVDVDHMKHLMDIHSPKLVSISHVPSTTGLIQPVGEVGNLCRERGILYLVDACQSVGQIDVDVKDIHCDFLCGTLRKFLRGPRGAGLLYVSDRVLRSQREPLFIDLWGADWVAPDSYQIKPSALRFEYWERSHALMIASRITIDYALQVGLKKIEARNEYLCALTRKRLNAVNFKLADRGQLQSSIITVKIPGKQAQETVDFLRRSNINTSISSRMQAQIDFEAKKLEWALRVSPHYFNTEQEIDTLVHALEEWVAA